MDILFCRIRRNENESCPWNRPRNKIYWIGVYAYWRFSDYLIGYVMNDAMTYYYIADLIQRYHIRKIVL